MEPLIIILLLIIIAEVSYQIVRTKTPHRRTTGRPIFVDTSVLIDGRIVAIAQSGFVSDTLMIPRSVIGELQFLADNADSEKRTKARHGLDIVAELQAIDGLSVEIFPDGSKAEEGVDERLLKLAKEHKGTLCTIDYNLNKVAQVENITVLNVNELARSLRMAYLPGEKITLALTSKGNDSTQAVGHLDDGTMVVVEQAKSKIGSVIEAEVVRSLQTAAGRMMFARLVESPKRQTTTKHRSDKKTEDKTGDKPKRTPTQTRRSSTKSTPLASSADTVSKTSSQAPQHNRAARNQPKSPAHRQSSRRSPRKTNEDRLIELLNHQDE